MSSHQTLAIKLTAISHAEDELRIKKQKLMAPIAKQINDWDHWMREHQGDLNPHGSFMKDDCKIQLYMGTNCGIYWMARVDRCKSKLRPKKSDLCKACKMVTACGENVTEDDDNSHYLQQLACHEFRFVGWNQNPFIDNPCIATGCENSVPS